MWGIWLIAACGWGEPDVVRSSPADPTVDLTGEGPVPYTLVWSDLAEMFPPKPGMVRPLAPLTPGMGGEEARAVLMAARLEDATTKSGEVDGHDTFWSRLKHGDSEVGATLIFEAAEDRLKTVDLAVDWGAVSSVLVDRWGDPKEAPPLQDGRPHYVWPAAPWDVELFRLPGGHGVLQYRRQETK